MKLGRERLESAPGERNERRCRSARRREGWQGRAPRTGGSGLVQSLRPPSIVFCAGLRTRTPDARRARQVRYWGSKIGLVVTAALVVCIGAFPARAEFKVADKDGRIEIHDGGKRVFGWQHGPLKNPKGGEIFAGSAFVHPLCTPSGFELTRIQPGDHLHHFGVWWPWKLVTVKGKKYITWEMQQKQGRTVGVSAKVLSRSDDEVLIEARNRTEIKPDGADYMPVIEERALMRFVREGDDTYVLDLTIQHLPVKDVDVEITKYRYSGFSWRGTAAWNKDNSTMRTSGGHDRDNANHEEADWVTVDGTTEAGRATMLLMSGAAKNGGTSERVRVWDSNAHRGAPFVNFNPVAKESLPLVATRKEVAMRKYRLVLADRVIEPDEADKIWKAWKAR